MGARLVLHQRAVLGVDEFTEIKVWAVTRSRAFPDGVKASFAFVRRARGAFAAVYRVDNERGKGLHEHRSGREAPLVATGWRDALARFHRTVAELREGGT